MNLQLRVVMDYLLRICPDVETYVYSLQDNLISLCDSCHRKRHPERAKKGARSRRRGNPYEP